MRNGVTRRCRRPFNAPDSIFQTVCLMNLFNHWVGGESVHGVTGVFNDVKCVTLSPFVCLLFSRNLTWNKRLMLRFEFVKGRPSCWLLANTHHKRLRPPRLCRHLQSGWTSTRANYNGANSVFWDLLRRRQLLLPPAPPPQQQREHRRRRQPPGIFLYHVYNEVEAKLRHKSIPLTPQGSLSTDID